MNTPNSNRTVLITGASRGLGAAIALEMGAAGADVAINYSTAPNQRIGSAGAFAKVVLMHICAKPMFAVRRKSSTWSRK